MKNKSLHYCLWEIFTVVLRHLHQRLWNIPDTCNLEWLPKKLQWKIFLLSRKTDFIKTITTFSNQYNNVLSRRLPHEPSDRGFKNCGVFYKPKFWSDLLNFRDRCTTLFTSDSCFQKKNIKPIEPSSTVQHSLWFKTKEPFVEL